MHYKFLKKIIGAFGYKLIDKNLVKNDRLISKYTHLTINNILTNLFNSNKVNSIIQIGSNDGIRFDKLNYFIKKHNPFAIFVEPIITNFESLKKNYSLKKNFIFENSAISVNDEFSELFKVKESCLHLYDDHIIGVTSFDQKHLIKHGVNKNHITKEVVNSISIKELLMKHSIENFDLLYMDTEGYDAKIVIDFFKNSQIRPIILFEYIHTKNQSLNEALKLLEKNKYVFFKVEENIFGFPEENKIKIF
tara:strand:- start:1106 stop:1852 length:747 start_codon:yes stop_codon:yes gene_type:complete